MPSSASAASCPSIRSTSGSVRARSASRIESFAATARPLALAGLWAGWRDPATETVRRTFTIITTTPNEALADLHDRMPVVIDRGRLGPLARPLAAGSRRAPRPARPERGRRARRVRRRALRQRRAARRSRADRAASSATDTLRSCRPRSTRLTRSSRERPRPVRSRRRSTRRRCPRGSRMRHPDRTLAIRTPSPRRAGRRGPSDRRRRTRIIRASPHRAASATTAIVAGSAGSASTTTAKSVR